MKNRNIIFVVLVMILITVASVSGATAGKVQFFNGTLSTATNTLALNFKLVNTGTDPITLSNAKLRYYFNNDSSTADSFACDWATAGNGNITGAIVTTSGNERYCEVGFTSGAGTLAAGAGTEVKARVWKTDWSNFDQSNDYSFNATATNYVDWNKVTLYINGTLYWGTAPGVITPTPTVRQTTPTPTRGVTATSTPTRSNTPTPSAAATQLPTATPAPGAQNATNTIEAESYVEMSGIKVESCGEGGQDVGYIENNDYAAYLINFTSAVSQIQVRAAGTTSGGTIEVRLNSTSGILLGTVNIGGTGGWQTYQTFSAAVSNVSGVQKVYLVFKGGSGYLFNINWFTFKTGTPSTPTPTTSANIVVAKDGSGQYTTVQAAISSVASTNNKWLTIYIKNGTYREVIHVNKPYIKMLGQSNTGTILTYNNSAGTAGSTSGSASVFFEANNFIAENLTFQNDFDYDHATSGAQAVAAEPTGDRQVFRNCRIIGHQDTLYVRKNRQYFKDCYIEGVTDFIFGDATAVFETCDIHTHNKGSGSCMTAPNTDSAKAYGLVFLNCKLTADSGIATGSITLGRPWGAAGMCYYLNCTLGAHCGAWSNMGDNTWQNARFGEYKSTGSGAVVNSSHPQLSASVAANCTVANILKGNDNWNPNSF
jgi:pectinesterase